MGREESYVMCTHRLIGAAMAVHNALGPGFREKVYERAFEVELG